MKMADRPYSGETWVRDNLAVIRTTLANQRTLLAYARTALALVAAGALFVKFTESWWLHICGWVLIPLGVALLALGAWRFRKTQETIEQAAQQEQ